MTEMQTSQLLTEENGGEVSSLYLILSKEHRVSRSIRTKWYIDHLLTDINIEQTHDEHQSEDVCILSSVSCDQLLPSTNVFFISHHSSLVFVLDMTSTMLQVSNQTFLIKLDEATSALMTTLQQLAQPITVPNSNESLQPHLCVTVLTYTGSLKKPIEVLIQGAHLHRDNVGEICQLLREQIHRLENLLAHGTSSTQQRQDSRNSTQVNISLEKMIRAGVLGIQLLPRNSLKGLILFTDGVGGFATPTTMYNTINQLRTANISCWVVLSGGGALPSISLGSLPDAQGIAFLTEACNGCVIDPLKLQKPVMTTPINQTDESHSTDINYTQKSILYWSLQRSAWEERRKGVSSLYTSWEEDPFVPQTNYSYHRTTIQAPFTRVLGCRIREGFFIQSIVVKDLQLDICLLYPWQPNVTIQYTIRTSWPLTDTSGLLIVTLSFEASYPFVRDFQNDVDPQSLSTPHAMALKRFRQTLKSLTHSDSFLSHLISFSSNPQFYTLPKSTVDGMPLFYQSLTQSKPSLSINTSSTEDKSSVLLGNYWKPLCSMDINIWPRWLHTDKIILVLNQDSVLPQHLIHPSDSGRYSSFQCRVAGLKLFHSLRSWSSIVFLENHSFLKFLPDSSKPLYFCLVRVAQMQPCLVVHIGFIEGTPYHVQQETLSVLNLSIKDLHISLPSKQPKKAIRKKRSSSLPHQPCATIIHKQLHKALISYDLHIPLGNPGNGREVPIQQDYMYRHQWQWQVPHRNPSFLMGLLRQRLREGFLIASAHNGRVTLVAQIEVKQPSSSMVLPSLIQYVLFPFTCHGMLMCEIWVEPQYLTVDHTPSGLAYLCGEKTQDIPYKTLTVLRNTAKSNLITIHCTDNDTLTAINTFLEHFPPPPTVPFNLLSPPGSEEKLLELEAKSLPPVTNGQILEVKFDLPTLYPKSHVAVFTFSTFSEDHTPSTPLTLDNCSPLNRLLNSKFHELLQQRMSPVHRPVHEPQKLINRLRESDVLNKFVQSCSHETKSLLWRCFSINENESLSLIFTPCFLCPTQQDTSPNASPNSFLFPLVIMHTTLPTLLGQDPLMGSATPIPPDQIYNCLFSSSEKHSEMPNHISDIYTKLKRLHSLAYLRTVHTGISQGTIPSRDDLEQGLSVCNKADLTIDLTPLLISVCHHCTLEQQGNITTTSVTSLLETLGDQRHGSCSIRFSTPSSSEVPPCSMKEDEVTDLLKVFLSDGGFDSIKNVGGYFWHLEHQAKEPTKDIAPPSVTNTDDDESLKSPLPLSPIHLPSVQEDDSYSDDDIGELMPIFSPSEPSNHTSLHLQHAPLFLHLSVAVVRSDGGKEGKKKEKNYLRRKSLNEAIIPLCLDSLFSDDKPGDNICLTMKLQLRFFSLLEPREIAELDYHSNNPLNSIHSCFQSVATSLKRKVEWLVRDELVSKARELVDEGQPVVPSLLQSVASHVQGSAGKYDNCVTSQETIKFVFGPNNSMKQFLVYLEAMNVPGYTVHKNNSDYFYLTPVPPLPDPPNFLTPPTKPSRPHNSILRCATPTPVLPHTNLSQGHKRSISWTFTSHTGNTNTTTLQIPTTSRSSISSMMSSTCTVDDSHYDASVSNSMSSLAAPSPTSLNCSSEISFWLVMRVLLHQVEIYLHSRCSQHCTEDEREKQNTLCKVVTDTVQHVCYKTNQWYLLKDLLDTHVCSPLLLPESPSDAWVSETVGRQGEVTQGGERFSSRQFECKMKWRHHITPHWRLKTMKMQAALRITRNALDSLAVSNRSDVYVLQDVLDDGEETIFYLKIYESLCQVDDFLHTGDEYDDQQRCETRATVDGAETMSTHSYQRSIPDLSETPQINQQFTGSMFNLPSITQESIVLELYGISEPSDTLQSRLQRKIQLKLDDAALEMMCSSYTRNQRLILSPADIQFLQPSPEHPSEVLSLVLPNWIPNPHALFFYILQQLSSFFIKPQYTAKDGKWSRFEVAPVVEKVLNQAGLPDSIQQDLLFLYIRPVTRGRGMALICTSLVSPEGTIIPPQPGLYPPQSFSTIPSFADITKTEIKEEFPYKDNRFSIALHIWERGNVGMTELREKLVSRLQFGLTDLLIESHYLHLPIASLSDEEKERHLSPGLLQPQRTTSSSRGSMGQVEPNVGYTDATLETPQDSEQIERELTEAMRSSTNLEEDIDGSPDWEQREKQRRLQMCQEALTKQAHMGQLGTLEEEYLKLVTSFLTMASNIGSPVIFHQAWSLTSTYVTDTILTHTLKILTTSISSSSFCTSDLTFSIFKLEKGSFQFLSVDTNDKLPISSSAEQQLASTRYVLIGRDLEQWKESQEPFDHTKHSEYFWSQAQFYQPLSSWKQQDESKVPLVAVAKKHSIYVPRQRMVLARVGHGKLELWMYNISENCGRQIKTRLTSLVDWHKTRSGFLHHILSQKMGLFHHAGASDISSSTQAAVKQCNTVQKTTSLVINTAPVSEQVPSNHLHSTRVVVAQFELDAFYQDHEPPSLLPRSPSSDPVIRHGHQFRKTFVSQREKEKQKDLFGKVFVSWKNQKDDQVPVNSDLITDLRNTSRLLHYCSSPLILLSHHNMIHTSTVQSREGENSWYNNTRETFINEYMSYLQTLNFRQINERPSSRPKGRPSLPTQSLEFYKCLQRSWTGGVILIELSFKEHVFNAKLFSLEWSRLSNQPPHSYEVAGLFSQECGRIKDFIHIHSFTYDFHIRSIFKIIQGRFELEGELNLRNLLYQFCHYYQNPPNFIRNRICTGKISVPVSVSSRSLYTHILGHCNEYGLQTVEVIQDGSGGCGSSTAWNNCLMIDLSPSVMGLTTTPELCRILHETREDYDVILLAIPALDGGDPPTNALPLMLYMLLKNKLEIYPRLTVNSPLTSTVRKMASRYGGEEESMEVEEQSQLHLSVRNHRRKLGYGSLSTPSAASQVVLNTTIMDEQMEGLKSHFENIVKAAQSHVRRDELWKRVLYGGLPTSMHLLSCAEFQELLQLVTISPLEQFDPKLTALQNQTKRWYRDFILALEERFNDSFKSFENNTDIYTVIINEGWHDMFVMLISDRDGHQQGLYAVYRKPKEGGIPYEERNLTANIEAEQQHISDVINFACCYLWVSVLEDTPSLSPRLRNGSRNEK